MTTNALSGGTTPQAFWDKHKHKSVHSTFRFHWRSLKQAGIHFQGNKLAHWTTITIIVLSLTIYSLFALLITNTETLLINWQGDYHMIVFTKREISPQQISSLRERLAHYSAIDADSIVTVSPEIAMQRLKEMIGTEAPLLNDLDTNPLPYMFEFRLTPENDNNIKQFAQEIATWPSVDGVSHDRQWAQRLDSIIRIVHYMGHTFAFLLLTMVGLIISNTIKLTISARHEEINAMLLMGATDRFIKVPFIYEGILQGLFGALLAIAITGLLYFGFLQSLNTLESVLGITLSLQFLTTYRILFLIAIGIVLGLTGSLLSLSRFLKI